MVIRSFILRIINKIMQNEILDPNGTCDPNGSALWGISEREVSRYTHGIKHL